jgi:hypothetical protein
VQLLATSRNILSHLLIEARVFLQRDCYRRVNSVRSQTEWRKLPRQ